MKLLDLVTHFGGESLNKQKRWREEFGGHDWSFSEATGILEFRSPTGDVVGYPAQILGYEGQNGLFRWAWAVPGLPENLVQLAHVMRDWGQGEGIPALVEPEIAPADHQTTPEALATIASGLSEAMFYFRGPIATGAIYLLVLGVENEEDDIEDD
jgi:hypothetical protein